MTLADVKPQHYSFAGVSETSHVPSQRFRSEWLTVFERMKSQDAAWVAPVFIVLPRASLFWLDRWTAAGRRAKFTYVGPASLGRAVGVLVANLLPVVGKSSGAGALQ